MYNHKEYMIGWRIKNADKIKLQLRDKKTILHTPGHAASYSEDLPRVFDFLDKLINVALPRIRDFRGLSDSQIDARGNLSIGLKEHIVFPEIRSDEVERIHGLQVNITTNASSREEGEALFRLIGLLLTKKDK